MPKIRLLLFLLLFAAVRAPAQHNTAIWRPATSADLRNLEEAPVLRPSKYATFIADLAAWRSLLNTAPLHPEEALRLALPTPEGGLRYFRVWATPAMEAPLAARYPELRTFTATALDAPRVSAKLDLTPAGFHGYIFDGEHSYLIDPYAAGSKAYLVYYKKDYRRSEGVFPCLLTKGRQRKSAGAQRQTRENGATRKTYRLALAADSEYCAAVDGPAPTKAGVLAKMLTTVNRINGVYERELSLTMVLVGGEDTLIFLRKSPYSDANGSAMEWQNQAIVTARIGAANYDIGHVFSTAGGGIAEPGCVCRDDEKAMGVTGQPSPAGDAFDIDFVAHEMGHQFGADHTFNASTGSCAANGNPADAFEPGSGSTIMAYAGICYGGNDFQAHSDDYFHSRSLEEISDYITLDSGGVCPVKTTAPYAPPVLSQFGANYNIPFLTPFELSAPSWMSTVLPSYTYCWEERDLGDFGASLAQTRLYGPLFRSFPPAASGQRVFPAVPKLVAGITAYNAEKLPDTGRRLLFRLTLRDVRDGWGTFNFADDAIRLDVQRTPAPFTVSSPAGGDTVSGGALYTVRWEVSGTDAPPVSCAAAAILLSTDSGYSFPYLLRTNVPNTGSATVRMPNIATSTAARVKVMSLGNVFFNLSPRAFVLRHTDGLDAGAITVSPNPATASLHFYVPEVLGKTELRIEDATGRNIWRGTVSGDADLPVAHWARGLYLARFRTPDGTAVVRKLVLR